VPWPLSDRHAHFAKQRVLFEKAVKQAPNAERKETARHFLGLFNSTSQVPIAPMTLLAVIDLKEVAQIAAELHLPSQGALNIFYDIRLTYSAYSSCFHDHFWRIVHTSKKARLTESPKGCKTTRPIGITLESFWALPPFTRLWPDDSGQEHILGYAQLCHALRVNAPSSWRGHRLGGWPDKEDPGETALIESDAPEIAAQHRGNAKEWKTPIHINFGDVPFKDPTWRDF
jgi:hypothetical protein